MIAAGTAHGHAGLRCYCQTEGCFQRVHPRASKNGFMHFQARGRHVQGCPYDTVKTRNATAPQPPRTYPAFQPRDLVPTHLGPPVILPQPGDPTPEKIAALARAVRSNPPRVPGTLLDVIGAWKGMTPNEKHNTPLYIEEMDRSLTYWSAFCWLGRDREFVARPTADDPILRGTATVRRAKFYYFVNTDAFFEDGTRLCFQIKHSVWEQFETDSLTGQVEFFWRGALPAEMPRPGTYSIEARTPYSGLVLLPCR